MTAKEQDWEVWQGEAKTLRFTIEDDSDVNLDTASDVTWKGLDGVVLTKGEGIEVESSLVALVNLKEEHTDKAPGRYAHELRVVDIDGNPHTLAVGVATVEPSLHHSS